MLKCKGLKQGWKWENSLTPCLFDLYVICSPAGKCFQRMLIKFFKENLIIVQIFRFLCRSRKSRSRTRYSIRSDFRKKQRDLRSWTAEPFWATVFYPPLSKHFPAAWSQPRNRAYFAFFPDFSHLFSDSDPLTFFPAAILAVYHIPIKIRETNNVLTQHSVNAHTKPLSEKQSLSESCGGSYQT